MIPLNYIIFGKTNNEIVVDLTINLKIGGVSGTLSNSSLVASKLGIDASRVLNFVIVGSDIECKITGGYAIPDNAFKDNTDITYYYDYQNCTSVGSYAFLNSGLAFMKLKHIYLENAVNIYDSAFCNDSGVGVPYYILETCILPNAIVCNNYVLRWSKTLKTLYIPRITALGTSVGYNNTLQEINPLCKIYVYYGLATNNGGTPDGDITHAIGSGATVRYVTNFTSPIKPSITSIGNVYNTSIQLIDTATSANAIDYYEVSVNNGVIINVNAGSYITGLTPSTSYNITLIAVDIFYNKSVVSNSLSVSTSSGAITDLSPSVIYSTAVLLNFNSGVYNSTAYKIYINGVLHQTNTSKYITGLTPNTTYNDITVRGVDAVYGEAPVSNVLIVSTNTISAVPTAGLVSYYKLNESSGNALDSFGGQNLTNTGITNNQIGKVGQSYLSTALGQKLETNSATPITGNFSINIWVYRTATPNVLGGIIQQGDYSTANGFSLWLWGSVNLAW